MQTSLRRSLLPLMLVLLPAAWQLSGCVSAAVGVGAAAATAASEERGLEAAANDLAVKTNINALLIDKNEKIWGDVSTTVTEGRVMLTGTVRTEAQREEAARIAGRARGVRELINEIQVTAAARSSIRDRLTTVSLRDRLLRDDSILSINFTIDTVNGTVYLMGIAQDAAEAGRVRAHARHVEYVRRVVDHIILKNDPRRPAARRKQAGSGA